MPIGILPDFISQLLGGQERDPMDPRFPSGRAELMRGEDDPWLIHPAYRRSVEDLLLGSPTGPGVSDLAAVSAKRAGLKESPAPGQAEAVVSAAQEEKAQKEAEAKAYLEQLASAREQDEWIRSLGYEPDQDLTNTEQGIALGDMSVPSEQDPSVSKLERIRQQAREMGGGRGAGGEGSFSQQEMNPEILKRRMEEAQWLREQPMRNASYRAQMATQRGDEAAAATAEESLTRLSLAAEEQKKNQARMMIYSQLSDGSGKIPYDKVTQLQALGEDVPWNLRGRPVEQGLQMLDQEIAELQGRLSAAIESGIYTKESMTEFEFGTQAVRDMMRIREQMAAGAISPDEAEQYINQAIRAKALEVQKALEGYNPSIPVEGE